jgi:hypothetical protein
MGSKNHPRPIRPKDNASDQSIRSAARSAGLLCVP